MTSQNLTSRRPHPGRQRDNSSRRPRPARPQATPAPVADFAIETGNDSDLAQTFGELGLAAPVVALLAARDITTPTPIQARTMPDALAGRDVLGRAQTGSGKTLAFGLPMLTRLAAANGGRHPYRPRGLVLVPTRELARQVADELSFAASSLDLRVAVIFGGASMSPQIASLRAGIDVLVATPGRLIDLMERRVADLGAVEIAVLDEADHMADLGFLPSVTRILDATPTSRQSLLFSATLDRGVDRLVARYLTNPAVHAVAAATASVQTMEHRVFVLRAEDKPTIAAEVGARPGRTLFFVRTKHGADRLAKQLARTGVDAAAIHGNLNQNQRLRALDGFASGRTRVLVATDVAARGLHVTDLDLVVHYDPPNDHKDYVHRSGRTARAGADGLVVSFVDVAQARDLARMHSTIGVRPTIANVAAGHPAVRAVAVSGEPIEVTAAPVTAAPERRSASSTGAGRSARSGQSNRRGRSDRTSTGSTRHRPAPRSGNRPSRSV